MIVSANNSPASEPALAQAENQLRNALSRAVSTVEATDLVDCTCAPSTLPGLAARAEALADELEALAS